MCVNCYVMFSCCMIKKRKWHSNNNANSCISSSGSPHLGSRVCAWGCFEHADADTRLQYWFKIFLRQRTNRLLTANLIDKSVRQRSVTNRAETRSFYLYTCGPSMICVTWHLMAAPDDSATARSLVGSLHCLCKSLDPSRAQWLSGIAEILCIRKLLDIINYLH